jgi:hypothetical protein
MRLFKNWQTSYQVSFLNLKKKVKIDALSYTVKVALYKSMLLRHIALLNLNGATSVDSLRKKL